MRHSSVLRVINEVWVAFTRETAMKRLAMAIGAGGLLLILAGCASDGYYGADYGYNGGYGYGYGSGYGYSGNAGYNGRYRDYDYRRYRDRDDRRSYDYYRR
jgi:hypothetical protein